MNISIELNETQINELYNSLSDFLVPDNNQYIRYRFKTSDTTISVYTSNKVVFQGDSAKIYSQAFTNIKAYDHAGSDEVGTGDYFGPVVVCGCIVKATDFDLLYQLKVNDSKKITDDKIREIAPTLIKNITHSTLILDNKKYNFVHQTNNMNAIKAKLHNQAYINLRKKESLPKTIIIDQFTPEKSYYNYLKDEDLVIDKIHFETKAESKYLAVAVASIIARYAFLDYFDKMSLKYEFPFKKGAGDAVDLQIVEFAKKYGKEKLNEVAKVHFKNSSVLDK